MNVVRTKQTKKLIRFCLIFIIFTFIFLLLFHIPLLYFFRILFYRGIVCLCLTLACVFGLIIVLKKNHIYFVGVGWGFISAVLLVSACLHLSFFILFPVTYERSISMYLLYTLQNHKLLKKEELRNLLIREYIIEKDAVGKRLEEQSFGTFVTGDAKNGVYLTQTGKLFLSVSNIIKGIYGIK